MRAREKSEVAELFDKYNLLTLPVVDDDRKLTGVITADDVISMLRAQAVVDIVILWTLALRHFTVKMWQSVRPTRAPCSLFCTFTPVPLHLYVARIKPCCGHAIPETLENPAPAVPRRRRPGLYHRERRQRCRRHLSPTRRPARSSATCCCGR